MKKLIIIFSVFTIMFASLYSQETSQTVGTESANTNDVIKNLKPFAPTFSTLRFIDTNFIEKDLAFLQTNVTEIRDEYLFRVLYKAEKILQDYTNSKYIDTNDFKFTYTYYYDIISNPMASDPNISLGIAKTDESFSLFNKIVPMLKALGKTNEVKQLDYDLNTYSGILHMYRGSDLDIQIAINRFNYIIDNNLTEDKNTIIETKTYLAGLYNILVAKTPNDVARVHYYNKVFDNLWDLTTLSTEDETLRNAQYQLLILAYKSVIDTNSARFKTTYSEHYDKMGLKYAKTEDVILGKEVKPEYKDETEVNTTTPQ